MKPTSGLALTILILGTLCSTISKAQKVTELQAIGGDTFIAQFTPTVGVINVNTYDLKDYKSFKIANLRKAGSSSIVAVEVAYVQYKGNTSEFYVPEGNTIIRIKLNTPIQAGYMGRVHIPKPIDSFRENFENYCIVGYIYSSPNREVFDSSFIETVIE